MADNYLEKKMEEHRLAAAAKNYTRRNTPSGDRPGTLSVKFNPLRVLVTDCSTVESEAVVRRMTIAGCRVAFISPDIKQGRSLSQSSGSRFYPSPDGRMTIESVIDDLETTWGGIDVLILTGAEALNSSNVQIPNGCTRVIAFGRGATLPAPLRSSQATVNAVDTTRLEPADSAQFCLYLCLPSSGFITGQLFSFQGA